MKNLHRLLLRSTDLAISADYIVHDSPHLVESMQRHSTLQCLATKTSDVLIRETSYKHNTRLPEKAVFSCYRLELPDTFYLSEMEKALVQQSRLLDLTLKEGKRPEVLKITYDRGVPIVEFVLIPA